MIKAAIVDDEPFAVENIELLLQEYFPEITICGTANSLQEGSELIKGKSCNKQGVVKANGFNYIASF